MLYPAAIHLQNSKEISFFHSFLFFFFFFHLNDYIVHTPHVLVLWFYSFVMIFVVVVVVFTQYIITTKTKLHSSFVAIKLAKLFNNSSLSSILNLGISFDSITKMQFFLFFLSILKNISFWSIVYNIYWNELRRWTHAPNRVIVR